MRELTSIIIASLNSELTRPVLFVEIAEVEVYAHTSIGSISANGSLWVGCGNVGSIGNIEDSGELQAANLDITLGGIPLTELQALMDADLQGSAVNIYIGVLDNNLQLDGDISLLWSGFVDTAPFQYGKEINTTIRCESELVDWQRPRLRRYNNADQQNLFAGDLGFEFCPLMEDLQIDWGSS